MYSNEDILNVLSLVKDTPEGHLIKMLKDKEITEVHVRLLIKLAKNSKDEDFIKSFNDEVVPKIKMSNGEHAIKEKFWGVCKKKLSGMGLLSLATKAAA